MPSHLPGNVKIVLKPGEHDVLLGRGNGTTKHCGNVNFRKLVSQHKMRYLTAKTTEKPHVAREVVSLWRQLDPPGRFCAPLDNKKGWYEIDDKQARAKTAQCLRDAERIPERKPIQNELMKNNSRIMAYVSKHHAHAKASLFPYGGKKSAIRGLSNMPPYHRGRSSQVLGGRSMDSRFSDFGMQHDAESIDSSSDLEGQNRMNKLEYERTLTMLQRQYQFHRMQIQRLLRKKRMQQKQLMRRLWHMEAASRKSSSCESSNDSYFDHAPFLQGFDNQSFRIGGVSIATGNNDYSRSSGVDPVTVNQQDPLTGMEIKKVGDCRKSCDISVGSELTWTTQS